MAKATRFAYSNLISLTAAVLVPSSEETAMPRAALLRAKTSDRLRFKTGWTIRAGENDLIYFNRGGAKVATIAAGYYATAAALAEAIRVALEAADATPVWACTYSGSTFKFTISSDLSFTLTFNTKIDSIAPDIGFALTDTGSATSHTGGSASYQSRHVLNVDLGSALVAQAAMVRGHNLSAAGTVTIQGDVATLVGVGLDSTLGPDYFYAMSGTDPRVAFFSAGPETKRYLRLIITDVQNSVGYNELGVLFVGPYSQPTILESINFVERYEPLSEVFYASGGAHEQVRRTRRLVYSLQWEEIEQANIDIFRALDLAMPMGASFFLSLDAVDAPMTSTVYGFFRSGLQIPMVFGPYSNVGPLEFAEALP